MGAAIKLPSETTRAAFDRELLKLPANARPRLKCECSSPGALLLPGQAGYVFKCRAPLVKDEPHFACGRYCCACVGGGDDNRCSECWMQRQEWLDQRAVREAFAVSAHLRRRMLKGYFLERLHGW